MSEKNKIPEGCDILFNNDQIGPYPDHLLKRVDRPTVAIPGPWELRSQCDNAAIHIRAGSQGEYIQQRALNFGSLYPLGQMIAEVRERMTPAVRHTEPAEQALPVGITNLHALSRHLKGFGYFLGADAIGICRIPDRTVYKDKPDGTPLEPQLPNAIVILKRNDTATSLATDGEDWIVDATAHRCYTELKLITEVLGNYIRALGYSADPNNVRHFNAQMPALVIEAGLAEESRMGIALNPFFGADFKVSAVFTDMPLEFDKPIDFGLQEYCARCGICAKVCPGKALSAGKKELYNGYEKWVVDAEKCFATALTRPYGSNCFKCIMTCPWTRPNTEPADWAKWDGSIEALHAAADARAAELRANDFVRSDAPGKKWWIPYDKEK